MQGMILERLRALISEGVADRVLGWEAGEFFYDRTPAFFGADNLDNLKYFNRNIPGLLEVSIGHALISDALYMGLENTIKAYREQLL